MDSLQGNVLDPLQISYIYVSLPEQHTVVDPLQVDTMVPSQSNRVDPLQVNTMFPFQSNISDPLPINPMFLINRNIMEQLYFRTLYPSPRDLFLSVISWSIRSFLSNPTGYVPLLSIPQDLFLSV